MWNSYQTTEEGLQLQSLPDEVREDFIDCLQIPFIKWMIAEDRPRAKDLPRDDQGRIIVDITKPHILEDMDYFRPSAIHYQKTGRFTDLKPNGNPNSAFGQWIREEVRRCRYGYVRDSDGEWIPGNLYYFLNYNPIAQTRAVAGSKMGLRVVDFPEVWDGIYLRFHYIDQARHGGLYDWSGGKNGCEISARGRSKSLSMASIMNRYFTVGESDEVNRMVKVMAIAYSKEFLINDGILNKFQDFLTFTSQHTEFPHLLLSNSINDMSWVQGWKDVEGVRRGTLNEAMGVAVKDDVSKIRGKRLNFVVAEEFGSFANIREIYNILQPSITEGGVSFGEMYLVGTAGDKQSDFQQATEIVYNPKGYNMYGLPNVWDKPGEGRKNITFFYPEYMNRKGYYDSNGNSDITGALIEILLDRYRVKYNTTDINTITRNIAERPITPQEAIMKSKGNKFPVNDLNQRLNQLDSTPSAYDDIYVGTLILNAGGEVEFKPTNDQPIRQYPIDDNMTKGALEIYTMPEKDSKGKVVSNRYICGNDPVDYDSTSESSSLFSFYMLDLFTDNIVCSYTGRKEYANENYELLRLALIFFNAKCLYEAHPYDQDVILPNGEVTKWKNIKVGDKLLSINGETTTVIDIPVDGECPIYEVTLSDGRKIQASDNHLWYVRKMGRRRRCVFTTREMLDCGLISNAKQHKFFIQGCGAVEYEYKDVPIDPYTFGLLIAEGSFTKTASKRLRKKTKNIIEFAASQDDVKFYKTVVPYEIKKYGKADSANALVKGGIFEDLFNLGLWKKDSETKFIPDLYKFNSKDVRLELLRGLMDGDGCSHTRGSRIFITVSKRLRDDIISLCRSLGMQAKWTVQRKKGEHIEFGNSGRYYNCKEAYRVSIFTEEQIFKLPRKIATSHKYNPNSKGSKAKSILSEVAIESIEFIGYKKAKCVTVDRKDGLYLIGDYVVTHNCNIKGAYSYFSTMNSLHLLADTPEYLKDKQLVKIVGYGNMSKGVRATKPINNYADDLVREWLIQPETFIIKDDDGNEQEITRRHLFSLRDRALIQELIKSGPGVNTDRLRALGMAMLYREHYKILYGGDIKSQEVDNSNNTAYDPFFTKFFNRKERNRNRKY